MRCRSAALVVCFVLGVGSEGAAQSARADLPADVNPESRNRLPPLKPGVQGVEAIRLHASGVDVRWQSPRGRQLTELAILVSAREHDQPYEWSLHEMEGLAVGLEPSVIDVVRHRKGLTGLPDIQAVVVEMGRQIFGKHSLDAATYGRALKLLGTKDLVDIVSLMGSYAGTATRLTAFNQQMPPGWKQLLPLPFTPPADIHDDTKSRLPYIKAAGPETTPGPLYSRGLAPEGTGPTLIRRHGTGMKGLEAGVGKRVMALAALATAVEHHQEYDTAMKERAARAEQVDAPVIDAVRHGKPLDRLSADDAALIQFARELFRNHTVAPATYARVRDGLGQRNLVDLVDMMARQVSDIVLLTAFDQH